MIIGFRPHEYSRGAHIECTGAAGYRRLRPVQCARKNMTVVRLSDSCRQLHSGDLKMNRPVEKTINFYSLHRAIFVLNVSAMAFSVFQNLISNSVGDAEPGM